MGHSVTLFRLFFDPKPDVLDTAQFPFPHGVNDIELIFPTDRESIPMEQKAVIFDVPDAASGPVPFRISELALNRVLPVSSIREFHLQKKINVPIRIIGIVPDFKVKIMRGQRILDIKGHGYRILSPPGLPFDPLHFLENVVPFTGKERYDQHPT